MSNNKNNNFLRIDEIVTKKNKFKTYSKALIFKTIVSLVSDNYFKNKK